MSGGYFGWTDEEMCDAWQIGQMYLRGEIHTCFFPGCVRQILSTVQYCSEHREQLEYERWQQEYERRIEEGPDGDVVRLPSGEALEPCYCGDSQCFFCGGYQSAAVRKAA